MVTLQTQQGSTIAFDTDKIQQPNSTFIIKNAGIREDRNAKHFVSVDGLETMNSFSTILIIQEIFVFMCKKIFMVVRTNQVFPLLVANLFVKIILG